MLSLTRWFVRDKNNNNELKDTKPRSIIPVDLNSILAKNADILAHFWSLVGNKASCNRNHSDEPSFISGIVFQTYRIKLSFTPLKLREFRLQSTKSSGLRMKVSGSTMTWPLGHRGTRSPSATYGRCGPSIKTTRRSLRL